MSGWIRNEWATREMRADPLCPPEACVFDKPPLRAFVMYADIELMPGLRWHIVLAAAGRKPDMDEAREAREALLPGIEDVAYLPARDHAGEFALHICEVTERSMGPRRQWRWLQ